MKRSSSFLMIAIMCVVLFSSCSGLRKMQTHDNEDVYLSPKKDHAAFYKPEEVPVAAATAKTAAAVPQDDPNNPYYKDRAYSPDDYYDNQYASRIKRFYNPTNGLGYYDSYYTNSYFYNQNPAYYGTSIYSSYNFWGPSYNSMVYANNIGGYGGYSPGIGYGNYCGMNGLGWGWGYQSPYYNNY